MSSRTLTIRGTEIYVDDTGEPDLFPVVCLHSLFLDGRQWDQFIEAARGSYRLIRPDFRGQGRSAVAPDFVEIDENAADVEAVLEHLGIGHAHFVVQSMGGDVAIRLAARRLDLFKTLVILGSSARSEPEEQLAEFRQWVEDVGQNGFVGPTLDTTMAIMFGETTRQNPDQQEMLELWRDRIASVPRTLEPVMSGVIERGSVLDLLPSIDVPSLIISGAEDLPRPPAWSDEVVEGLPDAALLRLPKVGHTVILEAPEIVESVILTFLRSADTSRPGWPRA